MPRSSDSSWGEGRVSGGLGPVWTCRKWPYFAETQLHRLFLAGMEAPKLRLTLTPHEGCCWNLQVAVVAQDSPSSMARSGFCESWGPAGLMKRKPHQKRNIRRDPACLHASRNHPHPKVAETEVPTLHTYYIPQSQNWVVVFDCICVNEKLKGNPFHHLLLPFG